MKTKIILLLLLIAIFTMSIAACGNDAVPAEQPYYDTVQAEQLPEDSVVVQDIGIGETVFYFEVTDDDGIVSLWVVHTNHTTVGAALVEVGLISGDETDFGLMVTYVDGLRADFNEDGAWWAFYIDGEMAMTGVDATEIEAGVTYAFVFTPA